MRIVARYGVELNGHIYRKGEACEYDGPVTRRIADNFRDERGGMLSVDGADAVEGTVVGAANTEEDKVAKTIAAMKREGIIQALDGMGITYPARGKTEYLAKLLLMSKGEIEA